MCTYFRNKIVIPMRFSNDRGSDYRGSIYTYVTVGVSRFYVSSVTVT